MKKTFISILSVIVLTTAPTLAATPALASELKIDTSNIQWIGRKVTGEHSGHIKLKEGKLITDDAGNITGGEFVIDMTSIVDTDLKDAEYNAKLTGHLKSEDFFSVDKFATATLKLTSVVKKGNAYDLKGDLTIKDITKPVAFTGSMSEAGGVKTLSAKIMIDRTLYNIRYGSGKFFQGLGDKLINDEFELNVKLTTAK